MLKIAVLVKRSAGLSVEAFQRDWRGVRGPAVARARGLRRYVQSHALPTAYRRGDPPCDGLDELWFDDEAAYEDFCARRARQDEDTGDDLLATSTVWLRVAERTVVDRQPGAHAIKSVILSRRKSGMSVSEFLEYWHTRHALVAGRLPGLLRYVQNPVLAGEAAVPWDGLALAWFESVEQLKEITGTPEYAAALRDERNFLEDGGALPIVLTREHVVVG